MGSHCLGLRHVHDHETGAESKHLALSPPSSKPGDVIYTILDSEIPADSFVLRCKSIVVDDLTKEVKTYAEEHPPIFETWDITSGRSITDRLPSFTFDGHYTLVGRAFISLPRNSKPKKNLNLAVEIISLFTNTALSINKKKIH